MVRGFAALLVLVGLPMAAGGLWLLFLGGSWYYALAGAGLLAAAALLWRGRHLGAWTFWIVLAGTVAWTAWESGLDYWRWVPRLGLMVALGLVLALLLPRLDRPPRRRAVPVLAGSLAAVFVAAFALAFLPHGARQPGQVPAPGGLAQVPAAPGAQPKDAPAPGDWAAWGRDNAGTRFSPLAQITADNVGDLRRAWVFRTGDIPERNWGAETTPLKVGDRLYLCTARSQVIALDAATGEEQWRFDPGVDDASIPYTAACRGVAYYEVPAADTAASAAPACRRRIVSGTLDARLLALDADTGLPCADFGDNGQVDITVGMGDTPPGYVSITSAPTIVRGVVVTGHQVLDGQMRWAPSGVIQGYDAVTGRLRWAWDMLHPERDGAPPGPGEEYARGTPNMWTTAAGDEALGLVYLPMGNSAADYWSGLRTDIENAYSSALVALDVDTGRPRWHFQTVRMDVWDYDLGSQPTLVDLPTANGSVPAVILPSKQGDIYVLDRRTGRSLFEVEERPAPTGGVEPERRARTQPHSLYATLAQPELTERDMWGLTPLDQLACRINFRRASYKGLYTPPTADRHFIEYTGYNGGSDWGSVAVDPSRGVIVANYNDMPNYNILVPREEADRRGWAPREEARGGSLSETSAEGAGDPQAGTPYAIDVNAGWRMPVTGLLCKEPPYGGIRAIELTTGRTLWDRPFGEARANGPFGIRSGLPLDIGTPNNGGPAVTAGGLVFIAAATDGLVRAIDIRTGKTVWKDVLPAGGQATPMVYEAGGRQYVAIVAGGHHFMETPVGDYVIAYALPR
ncbi:membrane-bound PQQ-dependent dehydrogenase, glucose/quinate/shikimate family [Pseudoxanthomonas broegbernensis]|nr:membrane-bound PQQ-dependent dehydrogenase, glucose/quinate/shikimate family [Pseudoxanthomonas broegbernensis]